MRAGKIALVVIGVLVSLIAFAVIVGGAGLLWGYTTQRDSDGFFTTRPYDLSTDLHAVTTEDIEFGSGPDDWWPTGNVGTLRLEATSDTPSFIGIGPSPEVDGYLAGVGRAVVDDIEPFDDTPRIESTPGGGPAAPPGEQAFWVASAEGAGTQTLTWEIEGGDWTAVLMNADGSSGVSADVVGGAKFGIILGVAISLLVGGLLLGLLAGLLLVVGLRRERPPDGEPGRVAEVDAEGRPITAADHPVGIAGGTGGAAAYPARLEGRLDPDLSRWMWLVKWFLAIPHFIVLAFLFLAYVMTTIVAGFAILFTTRYPRGLFDFNVGVIRWAWRVSFYCIAPLATDRYPPFTLAPVDYPATFDVVYPTRLNRWLPLVKWLLAIPHLIIVGLFTSGAAWWATDVASTGETAVTTGGGLVQILSLIAVVILLFTGTYQQGIFDLVMGMERWSYRTWAYVGLMTDDYPPFRFDMGGFEAATLPPGTAEPRPGGALST